jgi:hypothetical protein
MPQTNSWWQLPRRKRRRKCPPPTAGWQLGRAGTHRTGAAGKVRGEGSKPAAEAAQPSAGTIRQNRIEPRRAQAPGARRLVTTARPIRNIRALVATRPPRIGRPEHPRHLRRSNAASGGGRKRGAVPWELPPFIARIGCPGLAPSAAFGRQIREHAIRRCDDIFVFERSNLVRGIACFG